MTNDPRDERGPTRPPAKRVLLGEFRWPLQPARLLLQTKQLLQTDPSSARQTIVVYPGLGTGDATTWPMRRWLQSKGHNALGWGLGLNGGDPERYLPTCIEKLEVLKRTHDQRIHVVGWSLGGIIAREVARDRGDLVASVTTMGTPIVGGPRFANVRGVVDEAETRKIEASIRERNQRPIAVPVTAIFSRNDGIVHWRACIDRLTPNANNLEVSSTHLSMGLDPDIWQILLRIVNRSATNTAV
jgi:Alpha/beta hydrolase family